MNMKNPLITFYFLKISFRKPFNMFILTKISKKHSWAKGIQFVFIISLKIWIFTQYDNWEIQLDKEFMQS